MKPPRGFFRPNADEVENTDLEAWCVIIHGEEVEACSSFQCPDCGEELKSLQPRTIPEQRACSSCGWSRPIIPCSIERES